MADFNGNSTCHCSRCRQRFNIGTCFIAGIAFGVLLWSGSWSLVGFVGVTVLAIAGLAGIAYYLFEPQLWHAKRRAKRLLRKAAGGEHAR